MNHRCIWPKDTTVTQGGGQRTSIVMGTWRNRAQIQQTARLMPQTPIGRNGSSARLRRVGEPLQDRPKERLTNQADTSTMAAKHRNDQFAIDPPRKVQSIAVQSPPPLKIIGIARFSGKVSIIP